MQVYRSLSGGGGSALFYSRSANLYGIFDDNVMVIDYNKCMDIRDNS